MVGWPFGFPKYVTKKMKKGYAVYDTVAGEVVEGGFFEKFWADEATAEWNKMTGVTVTYD